MVIKLYQVRGKQKEINQSEQFLRDRLDQKHPKVKQNKEACLPKITFEDTRDWREERGVFCSF